MRVSSFDFSPGLVPSLAAVMMIILTLALGNWQLNRAAEKRALQQHYDDMARQPAALLPSQTVKLSDYLFRKVEVRGEFVPAYQILLDNKIQRGRAGYHVIAPLRIAGSDKVVLINRGWIARDATRNHLPFIKTIASAVRIEGIAINPSARFVELSSQVVEGPVWQNLTLERYAKTVPFALQPILVLQQNDTGDGLIRAWERPDTGITMHQGYAFQWFALALAILITYIAVNIKRAPIQS